MKRLLQFFVMLCSLVSFSQSITVSTDTYTVPQLVSDVLLDSPCLQVTNVSWRTGTNFGSTNGIGYFQNTNPNFPMQSGVVLTTGNVINAAGPNTTMLNNGSNNWPGDSSLEATLAASGISMQSINATVLEFDFVPLSSNFDFDFLFASEEYGNFQCQFSDAFAFLLTNLNTGVTTNLAVVPSTNIPISVVTIRDFLYNSSCPSVNPQFFGSFNGGANANSAPINFNGQTKVLNASATLTPNVPYRIKLVIADRVDPQSDSAIFLASKSFNIGQAVLGQDLLVSTGNAICNGGSTVLNTALNPSQFTFVWKKDGVTLSGETGPSLTVTQPGNYEVTYTSIAFPCQTVTDNIIVEYNPLVNPVTAPNIYRCDNGNPTANFDLTQNNSVLLQGSPSGSTVTFFNSLQNAEANVNALPNIIQSSGQTIYARVNQGSSGCFFVTSFQIQITPAPIIGAITPLFACARPNNQNSGVFQLAQKIDEILNGQSAEYNVVTFHINQNAAITNTSPVAQNAFTSTNRTIWIRIQNISDPTCFVIGTMEMQVLPLPVVTVLLDVIVCESYILPVIEHGQYFTGANGTGTPLFPGDVIEETQTIYIFVTGEGNPPCNNQSSFKVTIIEPESLDIASGDYCNSYTLPGLEFGGYFTGPNGTGQQLEPGTQITNTTTVYFSFVSLEPPFCNLDIGFEINIIPQPQVPQLENGFDCNSFTLQPLSYGAYYDAPNGQGNQLAVGTVLTQSQTVYIYAVNGECESQSSFQVIIGLDVPNVINECAAYILPQLPIGGYFTGPAGTGNPIAAGTAITTSQTIYVYAPTQSTPNCTDNLSFTVSITLPELQTPDDVAVCDGYILPVLNIGNYFTGSMGTGTALFAGDSIISTQTVYVYLNNGQGCENEESFVVTIKPKPVVDSRADIDICHFYVLTDLEIGNYFTGPNGTGTMYQGGDVITESQMIYIFAELDGCTAESSFQLNIYTIEADQPENVAVCDSYVLPSLSENNFYYTLPNGPHGTGTLLQSGTVITETQTLYVYIESGERINCSDENTFTVTIFNTPQIENLQPVFVCNSYVLPALNVGNYYTEPLGQGEQILAGTELFDTQTLYVYAESSTTPNCFSQIELPITIFNVDTPQNITTCESFVLPSLTIGNYFNGPNGTGGMIPAGTVVTSTRTIYVFAQSGFTPNCSDETSFIVTIVDTPIVNNVPLSSRTFCDEDGVNDGVFNLDLSVLNETILGLQTGSEFVVSYHTSLADAQANANAVTNTTLQTIFVRVTNTLTDSCFAVGSFQIRINTLPEPTPEGGFVCINSETGELINPFVISSNLSAATHTFEWYFGTTLIVNEDNPSLTVSEPGFYSVIATNIATGCSSLPIEVEVIASSPAAINFEVSLAFASNQTIVVNATGNGGNFEYQLNNGDFQDSNVFENVPAGTHIITVRDKNGCGISSKEVLVIDYPKFFTPNGDGFNDTWNITSLQEQENAVIFIFDRYGKLLTQLFPNKNGWDGLYNGNPMPSTDYWFTVTYTEQGISKEFKAHFALKR